jgi:DNA-binding NarL/FixJ family response regulator
MAERGRTLFAALGVRPGERNGRGDEMRGQPRPCEPILVVDDDFESRVCLAAVLERAGYSTCEAETGEEAVEAARLNPPALAVLDICLPGICGYEVFHQLREEFGEGLPVIFVSGARSETYDRVAGLLLGADDYFVKPVPPDEFLVRVRRLLGPRRAFDPVVVSKLTRREREVLALVAEGLRQKEIAGRLFISRKTVGTHVDHIFRKIGAHNRAEAVALAYGKTLIGNSA